MSELSDLYQEVIVDHSKRPRNMRRLADANHTAEGHNPLCGDSISIFVTLRAGRVEDVGFEGRGCAISMASASLMTDMIKGKTAEQVRAIFQSFHRMVTGKDELPDEGLDKLAAFEGVRDFPVRVKCATLAWHTLQAALEGRAQPISTE